MIVVVLDCVCHCENSCHHLHSALRRCVTLLPCLSPPTSPSGSFQALRCQEPLPGPRHRQPQTQQSWRQTPHAPGAGHHGLKDQVSDHTPTRPTPRVPGLSLSLPPAVCCRYESGDHVAVFPTNDTALVNRLGQILGVDLDVVISLNNLDGTTPAGKRRKKEGGEWGGRGGGGGRHLDSPISAAPRQF